MDNTELSFIDFNYTLFFLTIQSAIFDVCHFPSFQTSTLFEVKLADKYCDLL